MKALVGAFNQEKALVGAFSVIVQLIVEPMEHYTALNLTLFAEPSVMEPAVLQYPRPSPAPASYLPAPDNKRADYNQNKQLTHAARLSKPDRVLHNRCRVLYSK